MQKILNNTKINTRFILKFMLYFCMFMQITIDVLHFPYLIKYFVDVMLFVAILFSREIKGRIMSFRSVVTCFIIYFIFCVISLVFNVNNIHLFVWAFRNTFRGIVYFILLIEFFEVNDIKKIFNTLYYIQFISLFLALFQYFIQHHKPDDIGGIFGYGDGASLNTFNIMMISYYLYSFFTRKEKISKLLFTLIISFIIAALAEEKMTFIFFIALVAIYIIFVDIKFSKKISAFLLCCFSLLAGLLILKIVYPAVYFTLIDIDKLFEYSQATYDEGYRLPRIGSFKVISSLFFKNDLLLQLFGIGFGNSETSSLSFLQSSFYNLYGSYNYRWFTSQWVFIEQGYLGFISYLSIFISMFLIMIKRFKNNKNNRNFIFVGLVMSLYAIVSIWYNSTLKNDASYLLYFSIAIGFIAAKNTKKEIINK